MSTRTIRSELEIIREEVGTISANKLWQEDVYQRIRRAIKKYHAQFESEPKMGRTWAMPNKQTFKVYPIKKIVERYLTHNGKGWVDPFCGKSKYCEFQNDINPANSAKPLEASQFIKRFKKNSVKGYIIDPPFSLNQLKTLYDDFTKGKGLYCVRPDSMIYWSRFKDTVAKQIEVGGICISCGWNSMGLGKNRGFEQVEILLVPHGGSRNDTIVVVERKVRKTFTKKSKSKK